MTAMNFASIRNGSIYTKAARFDDQERALTEGELRMMAPSIFATTAHESRSERFQPIPTIEVVKGLEKEGFHVVGARQSTTRVEGKAPFTKHLLRLRRIGDTHVVGGTVAEMLLKNANDGTSAYELMAGLFRILCANSLVAQVSTLESTKVRHTGSNQKVIDNVIDGTIRVMAAAKQALAAPELWSDLQTTSEERELLARAIHEVRFSDAVEAGRTTVEPVRLLEARRTGDQGRDLWTVANVLQENVIRGGLQFTTRDNDNRTRRARTREVNGIDQTTALNRALWMITNHFAEQRGVKIAA